LEEITSVRLKELRALCGDLLDGVSAAHADDRVVVEHSPEEAIKQRWIAENLCDDFVDPSD
jgi:hypothetical protein